MKSKTCGPYQGASTLRRTDRQNSAVYSPSVRWLASGKVRTKELKKKKSLLICRSQKYNYIKNY
ncbi:hypothetical protein E2C01_034862 [Portunus trituberculatus]|uniref:Uncharacterized protein n=1 Tax=Portunus trituberculatus TaxID=210409 RepID=A0A5B7F9W7_PORTR|nr:hypothetical protein [Portunus trituberculatus]